MEAGDSELATGTVIGPYRIEALVGEGGMGKVFRAVRQGETEPVALKVMRSRLSGEEEPRRRFLREARAAGAVRHKHLVPVLDAGEAGDRRYLVMPYVPGRNLDNRLADGPLPVSELVQILAEVASGLDALHRAGLVHRDVKASNVLLDEQGSAALTDFGLAKRDDWSRLTKMGQVMGTVDYIAPELLRGEQATPASDLYALGCVTYEMVAGRPDAQRSLGQAVQLALEKDPRRRPPTATAFANLVSAAAAGR